MSSNMSYMMDHVANEAYARSIDNHAAQLHRAWNAYLGTLAPSLITKPGRVDDNIYVNFCRLIVDKGVSFLFGQEVEMNLDAAQEAQEEWLEDVWKYNRKGILLQRLAKNGGITGHAFLKIVVDPARPFPRLIVLDSSNVLVDCEDDDYEDVWRYTIQWNGYDRATNKNKVCRQRIEKDVNGASWWIIDEESYVNDNFSTPRPSLRTGTWVEVSREVWPYAFPPIVDCQNLPTTNQFWGMSDLEDDIIVINEAINRILSNINRMIRVHAWPRLWTKGLAPEQAKQIKVDPEGMIHIPSPDGSIEAIQVSGDIASSIQFYVRLRESLHELARVPEVATGKIEGVGNLSGAALQILYGPLVEKTSEKELTYGYLIEETCRRLFAIVHGVEDMIPELSWTSSMPRDMYMEAQTMVTLQAAGVSKHTTLEKAGFDPEREEELREEEADIAMQRMTAMQGAMGDRGQEFGSTGDDSEEVDQEEEE